MGEITTLFTQYSAGEVILLLVIVAFSVKAVAELWNYFYKKAKDYFGFKNNKDKWENSITDSLQNIKDDMQILRDQNHQTHAHQKEMDNSIALIQERLQENTRSYLIDAHHKFCYEVHAIDDLNLQAMERRYLYYKTAGGNSFIDNLMDEVRSLPRINFYTGVVDENHNQIDDRKE